MQAKVLRGHVWPPPNDGSGSSSSNSRPLMLRAEVLRGHAGTPPGDGSNRALHTAERYVAVCLSVH
jgi:hypothetical protein